MATEYRMDNSGRRPLCVPGFGGISIYHELGVDERFADVVTGWEQKPALTAPEMAMLQLMSDLTDKSGWNVDVFDETVVAKWREETFKAQEARAQEEDLKMRVISERAWDWCILELRDKALVFDENRFVRVFDAGSAVCKSDVLVSESARLKLMDGIAPLLKRPFSDRNKETPVDPSLFPLAYGKTSILTEGQVCLRTAVESFGTGKLSPRQVDKRLDLSGVDSWIDASRLISIESDEPDDVRPYLWSSNYQLLPCEVEFDESGTGTDAHITSYINNLHPVHYQSVYNFVEKLISSAIKPWNECLVKGEKARWPIRIRTYSLTWEPEFPSGLANKLSQDPATEIYKEAMKEAEEFCKLPNRGGSVQPPAALPKDFARSPYWYVERKWEALYTPNLPEPGMSFSYDDWKDGRNGAAIEEKNSYSKLSGPIQPDLDHEFYSIRLEDMFRDKGLQVIVKIGNVTPSDSNVWHMDTLNEHIVATAIYFYDVENTTAEIKISFRQRACMTEEYYHYNRTDWPSPPENFKVHREDIESMLGYKEKSNMGALTTQEIGHISAVQGRLITWPSTLQYCFETATQTNGASKISSSPSLKLPSPLPSSTPTASKPALSTFPGHCRYVMLSLVDPHYRICSTRNVPPQEHAWWAEEVHKILALCRIPLELAVMITEMTGGWPVSVDEVRLQQKQRNREREWAEGAFLELMDTVWFGGDMF
ncbi:hypothetical protein V495_00697 [Pseudogymnoascus sp. VKM F-4514 (FW-929)]|nr:hypothetical protein V495_00697 [Pseudogymnoascus sp. VKM F-4514 (FW-929)]KFY65769.1 hypothetical protein V497_01273 [Pseudogymnoascus sp. VKM F-4516 (FW-969)]